MTGTAARYGDNCEDENKIAVFIDPTGSKERQEAVIK